MKSLFSAEAFCTQFFRFFFYKSKSPFVLLLLFLSFTTQAQTLEDKWVTTKGGCQILDPYYAPGSGYEWSGPCKNGKADGRGTLKRFKDGEYESTYEGDYRNGIREGKGRFAHKDGTVKEGTFVNGQLTGPGKYHDNAGFRYEGMFLNYRQHGKGSVYYPNGSRFEGIFRSDYSYSGRFTNANGEVSYMIKGAFSDTPPPPQVSYYNPKLNEQVIEYFDDQWNRCDKKTASYYRIITYEAPNKPKGKVRDYYISGTLQSEFTCIYVDFSDDNMNFHEGEALWYHPNGKLEQKRFYFNNKINGVNTYWYASGKRQLEATYDHGQYHGAYLSWYPSGKLHIKAQYTNGELNDNRFIEFDEAGSAAWVYNEDFSDHLSDWEYKEEKTVSIVTKEEEVFLENLAPVTGARYTNIQFDQDKDFSAEINLTKESKEKNSMAGLLFGFKDWNNYYQFLISDKGSYTITGSYEGIRFTMKDWTSSEAVKQAKIRGNYRLKILRMDDQLFFSLNGALLTKESMPKLRGSNIGFTLYGKGMALVSTLVVKEFIEDLPGGTEDAGTSYSSEEETNTTPELWKGNGSGFFIDPSGYIATNYHVIKDARAIQVEYMENGAKKAYRAKVVKSDKTNDLAIIKINDPAFTPLQALPYNITPEPMDVGSYVFALGYPMALSVMGEEIKFTDGTISARTGFKGNPGTYQISVPIQPGNSGCPLFDNGGNLVGIVAASLRKDVSENVNYAIKASYLTNLVGTLPEKISLPRQSAIAAKPITEKIKVLSGFIPMIKIK